MTANKFLCFRYMQCNNSVTHLTGLIAFDEGECKPIFDFQLLSKFDIPGRTPKLSIAGTYRRAPAPIPPHSL